MLQTVQRRRSGESEFSSENSDKSSEISEAMRIVRFAAEPRPPGDTKKDAIVRASRKLGWEFERTRHVWYGDARRIEVCEMDQLRALEQERDFSAATVERQRHFEQLAVLRARLQIRDGEFHRDDIAAIDWLLKHHNWGFGLNERPPAAPTGADGWVLNLRRKIERERIP